MEEFGRLLRQQMTLDGYISWAKATFTKAVKQKYESTSGIGVQGASRLIVLQWVYITKVIIREVTLLNADMFGMYSNLHLLRLVAVLVKYPLS